MITVTCKCGWTTDAELTSTTNPNRCPKCGGEIEIGETGEPLYIDGELNPVLFPTIDEDYRADLYRGWLEKTQ